MDKREIKAIVEALLFIWGEPLSLKDISDILEIESNEVKEILDEMIDEFNYNRRGLKIVRTENYYQLSTRPEHHPWINKLTQGKNFKNLSNAALETLSIIAYRQPVTRNEIEAIRGVRCDKAIETLLNKDLIEEKGRLERTGRPIIYGTTNEFLRYFGLEDLDDLPPIKEFEFNDEDENLEE
ncbi:SMC-Scp complex subunit ScpB [Clostridium sp. Cult2]|uniref:SMC-Scp complex subunit ScpB n=1 Tax=Clostridium sp. Cult2 TaxID=2079003 RepID=UPI001F02A679|nr:SMC-Scp complex subunit ScpB [Clostridium sp. Cult2]MCF6465110.1 SMC-Scp complex subunit ScpB [Clostridium sp. Cult2]